MCQIDLTKKEVLVDDASTAVSFSGRSGNLSP
jgi:hypothetical protein